MSEANEDLKFIPERAEWHAPVMTIIAAQDAEVAGAVTNDGTVTS